METTSAYAHVIASVLFGGIVAASLVGCKPAEKIEPPKTNPSPGSVTGTLSFDLRDAVGAVVFGRNGEVTVVDGKGQPVPPCTLPGEEAAPQPTEQRLCQKVSNTAILELNSIAAVRHTGSNCLLLQTVAAGHAVSAGGLFQLPPGC
jgi:hypothetical protein